MACTFQLLSTPRLRDSAADRLLTGPAPAYLLFNPQFPHQPAIPRSPDPEIPDQLPGNRNNSGASLMILTVNLFYTAVDFLTSFTGPQKSKKTFAGPQDIRLLADQLSGFFQVYSINFAIFDNY